MPVGRVRKDWRAPRSCGFGMFNLVTGVALLLASVIAGILWDMVGLQGTFLVGAAFSLLALIGLALLRDRLRNASG